MQGVDGGIRFWLVHSAVNGQTSDIPDAWWVAGDKVYDGYHRYYASGAAGFRIYMC